MQFHHPIFRCGDAHLSTGIKRIYLTVLLSKVKKFLIEGGKEDSYGWFRKGRGCH